MTVHRILARMKVSVWIALGATTVFALQDSMEQTARLTSTNALEQTARTTQPVLTRSMGFTAFVKTDSLETPAR